MTWLFRPYLKNPIQNTIRIENIIILKVLPKENRVNGYTKIIDTITHTPKASHVLRLIPLYFVCFIRE